MKVIKMPTCSISDNIIIDNPEVIEKLLCMLKNKQPIQRCPYCYPPYKYFGQYYIRPINNDNPSTYILRKENSVGGTMIEFCPKCGRKLR